MIYNTNPVATLSNRKMELSIKELPARVGRNNNVVEVYLFHESVSREHCLFECINHKYTVRDLGSTVGTYINGVKLEPHVPYNIEDGAKIQLGKVKLVFHADYQALAEWEQMQAQQAQASPAAQPSPFAPEVSAAPEAPVAQASQFASEAPAVQQSAFENSVAAPAGKKVVSVSARELNGFEYDEDEVVYIDCGLKSDEKPLSYTSEIRKKEIEEAEAVDWKQTQVIEQDAVEAIEAGSFANAEPVVEEEPIVEEAPVAEEVPIVEEAPVAAEAPIVEEASVIEEVPAPATEGIAEDFADEGTFKIEEQNAAEERAVKTLHLTWIDDISGETKKLKIDHFPFSIGRKSDVNDYTIARKGISRKHMRFEEADGEIYLYDDASTNGVRLNGERITPETMVKLSSGDSIRVLEITFAVKID